MSDDIDGDLVLRAYEAWQRADIAQATSALHPEVEWIEPAEFPGGGTHHAPEAVAQYLRESRAMWAELHSERTAHHRDDDVVIVHHVDPAGALAAHD